ncbi:M15 family metallopeptidase [Candidatus Deianiraea vastatrix]|uniref:D-alanyl-D-alanine dipeptidase n=1 Tax=Candidatus Deianiraea vastatrix TaxID=2163644 RepID=A0A5B8XC00_9RICK|nr:M15 family metallopeptidase [Candidatus Deianiraea vastatrix]QED22868.1 D-alanyl-D-alanine dipeptidase [Candidatus Deianiraea vastatrix]
MFRLLSFLLLFAIITGCKCTKSTDLVAINQHDYDIIFDIRYATSNNFLGRKIYENANVYLHKDAAKNLKIATLYADKLGYKIKLFDGFRPLSVQRKLYTEVSNEIYVSNPDSGVASHTRGVALDVTLVDKKTNKELDMGTEFDSFEEKAHHNPNIDPKILQNRTILAGIMAISGFTPLPSEWWHYNLRIYEIYPDYGSKYPKM